MDEKGYLTTYACIIEYRRSLLRISTGISNYSIISLEKNKQWYVTGHYTVFCHFGIKSCREHRVAKNWFHFARKNGVSPVNSQIVMNWSFLLYMFIWIQFKDRFKERVHIQARLFFKEAALMVNKLTHQIYLLF